MAIGTIKPGYMGIATIAGSSVRCNDFSMQAIQNPLFYDHVFGLRDSGGGSLYAGKSDTGALNTQKRIMRASVKIFQGSISYPIASVSGDPLFEYAKTGDSFSVGFTYTCGISRSFGDCKINTYTFTATGGDLCQVSAEIIGITASDGEGGDGYDAEEKLLTWGEISVSVGGGGSGDPINAITFTVNNNCKPIYTAGGNVAFSLEPIKLRVGMQEVSGSISYYNKGVDLLFLEGIQDSSEITISGEGVERTLNVVFKPQERSGSIGPIISSLPFVGVDTALGE